MRIAVIGAGLAGLTAARELHEEGHTVVVWEKSRGPGGRTSTRRGPNGMRFDHGAPFLHDGHLPLDEVPGALRHRLNLPGGATREEVVGAPAANAPAKRLAHGLDLRARQRVETILRSGAQYHLAAEDGGAMGVFDAVAVTAPAPQAADLLEHAAPWLAERARSVDYAPCWSVMAAWDEPLHLGFTATTDIPGIALAVAEDAKPGRGDGERWVLQLDEALSAEHLEAEPDDIIALALDRWHARIGRTEPAPVHAAAHRWRYARPRVPLPETCLSAGTIVAAGDWCGGHSAGAAIRSGRAAAAALAGA
ncbi:MAG: NAD(P)/FAD-dependent oxidoreductase [Baekduiaceae bacterium]